MSDTVHELEAEARHVKFEMDCLSKAYIGFTMEEIIRLALGNRKEDKLDNRNDDPGRSN